jgi:hypothetical protein
MISAPLPAIVTEDFYGFPKSLQANAGIVPDTDHYRFLPNRLQLINLNSLYHLTLCIFDTEIVIK